MVINPSKVNLTEADIEEYLWQNPEAVTYYAWERRLTIKRWLKRQFAIPSGILDLFGETDRGALMVVEVKNVEVDARAIAQVCRYAFDMSVIMRQVTGRHYIEVNKVIVGPSISTTAFRECEACEVAYIQFSVNLSLSMGQHYWNSDFKTSRTQQYMELAKDGDLQRSVLDPVQGTENTEASDAIASAEAILEEDSESAEQGDFPGLNSDIPL